MSVPVVDFSACSLARSQIRKAEPSLSAELRAAFTQVGFVFLKNTGITQDEVDRVMEISQRFFLQPEEVKRTSSRGRFPESVNHGWVSLELERLNPQRPGDLKEAYNTCVLNPIMEPSSAVLHDLQDSHAAFFLRCGELSQRVLRLMAHSLDLDPDIFLSAHQLVGTSGNATTLRALYYPPVDARTSKRDQLRCGEHSDYGSITLLFQASEGLQVRSRSGHYLNIPVIPEAVLVNVGDLMQRWTNDHFVSSLHRVLLPPAGDSSTRQSLAFFLQPDDEAIISCCDGSNKYPPIKSSIYLKLRFADSFLRMSMCTWSSSWFSLPL
uniref:Si:dkey-10o6.2 n=1 Tax=Takifugu rubripes TaxID=31033 RepID=A0A674PRH2_TAKRU